MVEEGWRLILILISRLILAVAVAVVFDASVDGGE